MRWFIFSLLALVTPLRAEALEVDMELVLAVDISRSMSYPDLVIQRLGYAEALTSADVLGAIGRGMIGRIGVTYVEWSDQEYQRVLVPWTLVEDAEDVKAIAARLTRETGGSTRSTSISGGLLFAAEQFDVSPFTSFRRVIDISGDGPNNDGLPVSLARDRVVNAGITINGLPLMLTNDPVWSLDDLDAYYRDCVTGGPGAFVVPVVGWEAFPAAVRRKLVLEIAGARVPDVETPLVPVAGYDCLVGEKIRERRRSR